MMGRTLAIPIYKALLCFVIYSEFFQNFSVSYKGTSSLLFQVWFWDGGGFRRHEFLYSSRNMDIMMMLEYEAQIFVKPWI